MFHHGRHLLCGLHAPRPVLQALRSALVCFNSRLVQSYISFPTALKNYACKLSYIVPTPAVYLHLISSSCLRSCFVVTGIRPGSSHISLDPNSRLADAFAIYGVPRGITQYMSRKWTQPSTRGNVVNLAPPMRRRSSSLISQQQLQVCVCVCLFTVDYRVLTIEC